MQSKVGRGDYWEDEYAQRIEKLVAHAENAKEAAAGDESVGEDTGKTNANANTSGKKPVKWEDDASDRIDKLVQFAESQVSSAEKPKPPLPHQSSTPRSVISNGTASTGGILKKSNSKRHIMKYNGDVNGSRMETASMYSGPGGARSYVSGTSTGSKKPNSVSEARKYDVIW